ncbi:MAG: c-type cytochrome biogenesis protein CcmI [Bauldia sp.]
MAFWIAIAVLTAAATIALLAPIYRSRAGTTSRDAEVAIYRDQLDELTRDVARGVLPESEAKSARNEIARRLLKASEEAPDSGTTKRVYSPAILATVIAVPILAVGLYLVIGEPNEPDMPIEARLEANDPGDAAMVLQRAQAFLNDPTTASPDAIGTLVDGALALHPDEPALWETAAVVYLHQQRFDDVVTAYDRLIETGGAEADPEGAVAVFLGEQMIAIAGAMTQQSAVLFGTALQAHPDNLQARFYTALILTELGQTDAAIPAWQWIIANAPPEAAPLIDAARAQLVRLGVEVPPADPAATPAVPPGAADLAALPPDQQDAQIAAMVARLDADLTANGGSPDRWAMLVRSYLVLGRVPDARTAVTNARTALATDAQGLAALEDALILEDQAAVQADPTQAEVWARLIVSYSVLGRAEDATQALANARAALAGNPAALAVIDAAAQELEVR